VKIHALTTLKNEADVVAQALTAAAEWCDHIYVLDNGSTDGTWEIVEDLAETIPAIVPWKIDDKPFTDSLRAEIFDHFRSAAGPDDWWCEQDADEFYVDDPRVFLRKVPKQYSVVWAATFSYYFTDRDAALFADEPERYADDVPVESKIRYYLNHWSEPRFFRHSDEIIWRGGGFPPWVHSEPVYPVRIWLKHFPYRSPAQIGRRLADRSDAVAAGHFSHEAIADWGEAIASVRSTRALVERTGVQYASASWEDRIVPAASLDFDAHDCRLVMNESLMPPIPDRTGPLHRTRSGARRVLRRRPV
jgi:hypothetical protein